VHHDTMEKTNYSSTADQYLSSEDTDEPTTEESSNTAGRIDALNYVNPDHPLLPPRRARSANSLATIRSRVRYHTAFWWDVFLAMQEEKNPDHYRALRAELTRLRQNNEQLEQTISRIRQQGYNDRATIDYLGRASSANRGMQTGGATHLGTEQEPPERIQRILHDSIRERKRKRNRIAGESGNSDEADNSEMDSRLREKLKQIQEENKAKDARLGRLEAAFDKLTEKSYEEGPP